jgi:2-polyprenyl-3-methyl-5-hydroxy-6-metoxy-1,4-benzoquinol methylase
VSRVSADHRPDSTSTFWNDWFARQGHTGWSNPAIYRHDQKIRVHAILSALESLNFDFSPSRRALDIGCGTGDITAALASRGIQVVGYDISSGIIEQARARFRDQPTVTLECANLVDAHIEHGPYDLITSVTVLQHQVDDRALREVLTKLSHALKPDGRIVVLEVVLPEGSAGAFAEDYVRPRTRSEWLAHFESAGLELEHERPYPQAALTALGWIRGVVRRFKPKRVPSPTSEPVTAPDPGEPSRVRLLGYQAFLAVFVPFDHWLRLPTPKRMGLGRIMTFKHAGRVR